MEVVRPASRHGIPSEDINHAVAKRGYEVDALLRRRRCGRPPLGSEPASVESVRLDPELKCALLLRAAEEHISVSEVIQRAIREYLQAS